MRFGVVSVANPVRRRAARMRAISSSVLYGFDTSRPRRIERFDLETCRAIRNGWDMPIIIVSVRDSDKDKVEALDAGADDFVSKPFSTDELMARIRAALRRTGSATDTTPKHISAPNLKLTSICEKSPPTAAGCG